MNDDDARIIRAQRSGYVYIIKPVGHNVYKVGCTVDIPRRLARLQRRYDFKLKLVTSNPYIDHEAAERYWHDEFSKYYLIGEWFVLTPNAIETFKQGVSKYLEEIL